jgi:diadenylate cyclase
MNWFRWQNAVDFAVLAAAVYVLLQWARGTRALRVVVAILGLHAAARIAWQLDLTITGWLLDISSGLLVVMLLFFFQPELRHAFMRLDGLLGLGLRPAKFLESSYEAVSEAAFSMAAERVGALIVIARKDSLRELVRGGTSLGAEISSPILTAIFRKDSPLHDGALLIEGGRISRAGAVLPLTQKEDVPPHYGTRHRAAMGFAERCDALIVVVSEERGEVTLMQASQRVPVHSADELVGLLRALTAPPKGSRLARLRRWCVTDLRYKLAAGGVAAVLWAMSVLGTGATVRLVSVPIEFSGVPAGLEVSAQSAARLEVQMRGTSWLMASVGLTGMVARFDLRTARQGPVTLKVGPENLNLPPGVSVDRVRPESISVRLVRRSPESGP